MTCRRFEALDAPLRDLWRRRATLSRAEWGELYGVVWRVLSAQRLALLQALPGNADEYIQDFFQDKVMRFGKNAGEIAHTGALVVFFERYLASCLRALPKTTILPSRTGSDPDDPPPDPLESQTNRDALKAFLCGDQDPADLQQLLDLVADALAGVLSDVPGAVAADSMVALIEQYLGIHLIEVLTSARHFLAGDGDWVALKSDRWWIRPYLREHFCSESGEGLALSALARRYRVPAYHYKAVKLGVTVPGGEAAALAAFSQSYRGQWLRSLGIPVDADHRIEMALALKILCLIALNSQEPSVRAH